MKMKKLFVLPLCLLALPCVNAHAGTWDAVAPLGVKPNAEAAGATATVTNVDVSTPAMRDEEEGSFYYAYTRDNPADAPTNRKAVHTFNYTGGTSSVTLNGGLDAISMMYVQAGLTSAYNVLGNRYYDDWLMLEVWHQDAVMTRTGTMNPRTNDVLVDNILAPVNDLVSFKSYVKATNGYSHVGAPSGSFVLPTHSIEVKNVSLGDA